MSAFNDRTGEIRYNNFGSKMIIKEYRSSMSVDVYFPKYDWVFKNAQYNKFKNGNIKCPYEPRACNVGYEGEGEYSFQNDVECYNVWFHMLRRCYDKDYLIKFPTYENCEVYEEWCNFQNFAKWYYKNYYEVNNEKMVLDKDILIKGNKIYSPKTCIFVPEDINLLFVKSDKKRGKYPIGVSELPYNKFRSRCNVKGKRIHIGVYNTPEEAFIHYKYFKEKLIKQIADEYKPYIPKELYDAMYKWEVEIND